MEEPQLRTSISMIGKHHVVSVSGIQKQTCPTDLILKFSTAIYLFMYVACICVTDTGNSLKSSYFRLLHREN